MIYHVTELTREASEEHKFVVLDTNILIQLLDTNHFFYQKTISSFQLIAKNRSLKFIYFLASKLEWTDYMRKCLLTKYLRDSYHKDPNFTGGNGSMDQFCRNHEKLGYDSLISNYLTDKDIKDIRNKCFGNFDSVENGINTWQAICNIALKVEFSKLQKILEQFEISYVGFDDKEVFRNVESKPSWKEQEDFIFRFGLGSSDAAILNMANRNMQIHGVVTNDSDMIEIFSHSKHMGHVRCYTFLKRYLSSGAA